MTVEAWVNPTTLGNAFRTVVFREEPGNEVFSLYGNQSGSPQAPVGEVRVNGFKDATASTGLATGTWTHLAETYDGSSVRLYVNGALVSTTAAPGSLVSSTAPLRIGGNNIWGEYFSGLIDEVRVYNRALSAAEIQQDMSTAISNPDATPPSAPGTLTATGGLGQVNLSWGAATDNIGVLRYNVYRSTTPGFTPSAANRIAQPTGTSYTDSGLATGTYYYRVIAEDGAGNLGPPSNEASASATADTTPPSVPGGLAAAAAGNTVNLSWNAATDNVGVARYNVYRSTTSGFTPSTANRIAQPTGPSYADSGLAPGTYYYKVTAEDAAGNVSGVSSEVNATVAANSGAGLVAAYSFDAGAGTSAVDSSGNGNTGTLANATWASGGKYGSALSFNGTNAWVTVNSSTSLALTNGMTVEAWVNPTTLGNAYRTVVFREQPGSEVYSLYANQSGNPQAPLGEVYVNGFKDASASTGLATGSWAHLAETYDGSSVRLYVNGTLVSTTAAPGSLASSTAPLRIGGNNIWGEYFSGLIDEVRVYNRALSAAEIQLDMSTSITPSDAQPPTAPGSLAANGALTSASLTWAASTDNVGVVRYNVYRSTTSGFTPSVANRIAQPTGTSYTDSGLAGGTYYYKVTAEDGAGNLSAPSNEASALVGDSTPPSAPGTLNASGGIGKATLSWGAATDNVGVVRYNVHRGTSSGFTPSAANRIAQPTGTSYTDTGLAAGTYFYKVTAEDAAGNVGSASNEASATATADTTPPTAPANLAASVAGGTVNLSWTASTDDVGVARYDVYRDTTAGFTPSTANRIAQPTGTTYSDTSIFALGTYYYKVIAEDAAGNLSTASNEVSAAIADTTPPGATTGLAANASGTSVSLTWTAATDNVGVVRYNVHRSTTSGFTPSDREPDRPADGDELHRHRPRRGHLLLQGHRRGRRRQRRRAQRPGERDHRGHDAPDRAHRPERDRRRRASGAVLDRGHGQRRRRPLQRAPLDHLRLHAEYRQPDRPADGDELHRHRPRRGNLLLQGHRRGRRRQRRRAQRPGERDGHQFGTHRSRRGLRFRRRQRHDDSRPVGQRQHGHAFERDLVDGRQVRQRPLLQRHQRARERERLELTRHHERDDARGLGQADAREHGLPDDHHEGADR